MKTDRKPPCISTDNRVVRLNIIGMMKTILSEDDREISKFLKSMNVFTTNEPRRVLTTELVNTNDHRTRSYKLETTMIEEINGLIRERYFI